MNVACFCGCAYSFAGEVSVCPRCGRYASLRRASDAEEQQMRADLDLLTDALAGGPLQSVKAVEN
jgi:hypothetical protein